MNEQFKSTIKNYLDKRASEDVFSQNLTPKKTSLLTSAANTYSAKLGS